MKIDWHHGLDGIWPQSVALVSPYICYVMKYGYRDWRWTIFYGGSGPKEATGTATSKKEGIKAVEDWLSKKTLK